VEKDLYFHLANEGSRTLFCAWILGGKVIARDFKTRTNVVVSMDVRATLSLIAEGLTRTILRGLIMPYRAT
jgi:hypothetical protein